MSTTYRWDVPGATCANDDRQAITLHLAATVTDGPSRALAALSLQVSGPGMTCGAKWSPAWAERAVAKLGWVGLPLATILACGPLPDRFTCACTEISLGPKLLPLLAALPPAAPPAPR